MQSTAENIAMTREDPQSSEQRNEVERQESEARALVDEIARDAADAPERYLRETVVPEGGE